MTAMDWNDLANRPLPSLSRGGAANPRTPSSTPSFQQQQLQQPSLGFGGAISDPFMTATATATTIPHLGMAGPSPAPSATVSQTNERSENIPTHFVRLEDRLIQYEQDILKKVLRDTEEKSIKLSDALLEASLQKAWEQDRQQQIKEWLGPRNNVPAGGTATSSRQGESFQTLQSHPFGGSTTAIALVSQASPPPPGQSSPPPVWPEHQHRQPSDEPLDLWYVQTHLNIVQRMTDSKQGVDQFCQFSSSSRTGSGLSPIELGYRSAWLWMKEIIRSGTTGATPSPIDQAVASLRHLCMQFQGIILDRNRQGSTNISRNTVYQHDVANQCAVFCQISLGLNSSSHWPIVFYCLRSGHAVAALEVFQQSALQQHPAVLHVLQVLAHAQGLEDCLWQNHSKPPQVSLEDRRRIHDLWKASQHREPTCGIHEQGK